MDNIVIKKINYNDGIEDLKVFFEKNCGSSAESFTYFNKRSYNSIQNHLVTNLIYLNQIPCGYSHLDKEEKNIWFGLCIGEKFKGKKLGELLIKKTLEQASELGVVNVLLSVYKTNAPAIRLYEKIGFVITHENNASFFMKKEL